MTTIVTDGKSMSSDGLAAAGDIVVGWDERKLHRLSDGSILGCAGRVDRIYDLIDWLEDPDAELRTFKGVMALRLYPDGHVEIYEGRRFVHSAIPAAVGSGWQHALTAMDMGATTEKAIEMAAKRDVNTGGRVETFSLE